MISSKEVSWSLRPVWWISFAIGLIIGTLTSACTDDTVQLENAFPTELKDVQLGMSSVALSAKITKNGKHSIVSVPKYENRKRIIWKPSDSPYYTSIAFDFTRKDRLYNIRFALRRDLQSEKSSLRQTFKNKLRTEGNPLTITRPGKELKVYAAENSQVQFVEFMDLNDKQLYFEMFSRIISATDRPSWKFPKALNNKANQKGNQKNGK